MEKSCSMHTQFFFFFFSRFFFLMGLPVGLFNDYYLLLPFSVLLFRMEFPSIFVVVVVDLQSSSQPNSSLFRLESLIGHVLLVYYVVLTNLMWFTSYLISLAGLAIANYGTAKRINKMGWAPGFILKTTTQWMRIEWSEWVNVPTDPKKKKKKKKKKKPREKKKGHSYYFQKEKENQVIITNPLLKWIGLSLVFTTTQFSLLFP